LLTFQQDVKTAETAKNTGSTNQTAFASIISALLSLYTTAQAAAKTADLAVASTKTSYKDAQATVAAEQSLLDTRVAAVRALKPTWTPA
jgi:uncharacterized low-complexity protein